jgi:hypothetical protein
MHIYVYIYIYINTHITVCEEIASVLMSMRSKDFKLSSNSFIHAYLCIYIYIHTHNSVRGNCFSAHEHAVKRLQTYLEDIVLVCRKHRGYSLRKVGSHCVGFHYVGSHCVGFQTLCWTLCWFAENIGDIVCEK